MFFHTTSSTFEPIVGLVCTTSFIKNWYNIVVLPALSNPTITNLCSGKKIKYKNNITKINHKLNYNNIFNRNFIYICRKLSIENDFDSINFRVCLSEAQLRVWVRENRINNICMNHLRAPYIRVRVKLSFPLDSIVVPHRHVPFILFLWPLWNSKLERLTSLCWTFRNKKKPKTLIYISKHFKVNVNVW